MFVVGTIAMQTKLAIVWMKGTMTEECPASALRSQSTKRRTFAQGRLGTQHIVVVDAVHGPAVFGDSWQAASNIHHG